MGRQRGGAWAFPSVLVANGTYGGQSTECRIRSTEYEGRKPLHELSFGRSSSLSRPLSSHPAPLSFCLSLRRYCLVLTQLLLIYRLLSAIYPLLSTIRPLPSTVWHLPLPSLHLPIPSPTSISPFHTYLHLLTFSKPPLTTSYRLSSLLFSSLLFNFQPGQSFQFTSSLPTLPYLTLPDLNCFFLGFINIHVVLTYCSISRTS